jgi:hypothetical protein
MRRELIFTPTAYQEYKALSNNPAKKGVLKQVRKTLALIETNLRHPSLNTHEYHSLTGLNGEKVFEAYAQQKTPAAYRVFFHYGPDRVEKGERIPVITIFAITPHP